MAAKISNFQMFPTAEELIIQANNCQKICLKKKIIIREKDDYEKKDDNYVSTSVDSANSSSCSSFSSSDLMEDATSSPSSSSSSSSSSNGPLFQLSDLMDKLPIKRGLSKYYQGKSQSFTSLASVESLEDLAKRENPYNKRIKLCRSYCSGFDSQKFCSPKPTISKKSGSYYSRTSSFPSSVALAARRACSNNLMASCKPPTIPSVQKHF